MNNRKLSFFDQVKDTEAIQTILNQLEKAHNSKVKRVVRTAFQDGTFFATILLENYEMLELSVRAGKLGHMAALECEVEVF